MSNTNEAKSNGQDAKKGFGKVDLEGVMGMYKKNLEILSLVNQMSFDVYKSVAKLQATFLQQMISDACDACSTCTCSKPSESMNKFADIARTSISNALNNGKQISEILTSTGQDISGVLTKRFEESIEEMKKAYKK